MAKLKDQYNEIFNYVGEKFGLSKLTYETYLGLNKDDVRKKRFDNFIANNLPIDKAMDKGKIINEVKPPVGTPKETYGEKGKPQSTDTNKLFKVSNLSVFITEGRASTISRQA